MISSSNFGWARRATGLGLAGIVAGFASGQRLPIRKAEEPTVDLSKGAHLYVVPYSHLDTQWRWAYPQVIREYIAHTLHDNFDLIDRYPNYVFNFSGSRRYEMMKEYYPEEYERVKAYVAAGRWFPCGSSVDECDANVPSGESLIRHVLYGNHFFRREFGKASSEFMLPDCFGFPYALPSILAHCGVKGFSTQKLTWGSANGIPFKVGVWIGPDTKSVVAALDPGAYTGTVDSDLSRDTGWLARIADTGKKSGAFVDYHYYGTGDRGGAPRSKSVDWVEKSVTGGGPIQVHSTTSQAMYNALTPPQIAKLPRYRGELLLTEHSAGSISSQATMKRWNRKNELLADVAEKASVAATWLNAAPYPAQRLYDAWNLVLGSQMHDMLPGTSIPKAYEFCWNDELLAANQFSAMATDAVGGVAARMDTQAKGVPLVVFNPLGIDREDVVECSIDTGGRADVVVHDGSGKALPTQTLGSDGALTRVLFSARVPSVGFAVFDARLGESPTGPKSLRIDGRILESARFRVAIDRAGDVASIYDKRLSREVLKAPLRLGLFTHNPRQFPAWNMDWEDAKKSARAFVGGPATIRVVEDGPVRIAIEVARETEGSRFVQTVRIAAGPAGDRVEVANRIDWQSSVAALKAVFPLKAKSPKAVYDLQLGAVARTNDDPKKYEVPQQQWFDLTDQDGSYGVTVINDGKYGSNKPADDVMQLTLVYTPGVRGGFHDQATQDWGRHDTLFAIAPHEGDWRKGGTPWIARRVNQPLRAFVATSHPGVLGRETSLCRVSSPQVEIQAIKKAEDSNQVIIRLRELMGRDARGVVVSSALAKGAVREVDGQERPIGPTTPAPQGFTTQFVPFGLRSFAVQLTASQLPSKPIVSRPLTLPYDVDVASGHADLADGDMDKEGRTYPAERLPASLEADGVRFALGPIRKGAMNAVAANGEVLRVPAGFERVYLLAASSSGDVEGTFTIAGRPVRRVVQDWGGFIGLWDNRLWRGDLGPNFTNYGDCVGLRPGFVRPGEVAWFCSHRHNRSSGVEFYDYCYLYKIAIDVPAGGGALTLPRDPRIKVFAATAATGVHDRIQPAADLFDRLTDHLLDASSAAPVLTTSGSPTDVAFVYASHPLYWREGGLRYTLDGSRPSALSPEVAGPIALNRTTTVSVAMVEPNGTVGPVATRTILVDDVTPPSLKSVATFADVALVRLRFSEAVDEASATSLANYQCSGSTKILTAKLGADRRTVELTLDRSPDPKRPPTLTIQNIRDLSPSGNPCPIMTVELETKGPVVSLADSPATGSHIENPALPVHAGDAWTINCFVNANRVPNNRTLLAGFGEPRDGQTGVARYFAWMNGGLTLWIANLDVKTRAVLNVGEWTMLTATYDGRTVRVFQNGEFVGEREAQLADDSPQANVAPLDAWARRRRFDGAVRDFTIWADDLTPDAIRHLWANRRR